jgi:hypothetical protein
VEHRMLVEKEDSCVVFRILTKLLASMAQIFVKPVIKGWVEVRADFSSDEILTESMFFLSFFLKTLRFSLQ